MRRVVQIVACRHGAGRIERHAARNAVKSSSSRPARVSLFRIAADRGPSTSLSRKHVVWVWAGCSPPREERGSSQQMGRTRAHGGEGARDGTARHAGSGDPFQAQGERGTGNAGRARLRQRRDSPRQKGKDQRRIGQAGNPGPPGSDARGNGRRTGREHLGSNGRHDTCTINAGGSREAWLASSAQFGHGQWMA